MTIRNIYNSLANTISGVKTDRIGIDKNGNSWKSLRYTIINPPTHITIKKLPSGTRIRSQYTGSGILEERQILKPDGSQIIGTKNKVTILKPAEYIRIMVLKHFEKLKVIKDETIPVGLRNLFNKTVNKQIHKIR